MGNFRRIIDSEIVLKAPVYVVEDTPHSCLIDPKGAAGDPIDHVAIDVVLDKACRQYQGRHLRDHAACCRRIRQLGEHGCARLSAGCLARETVRGKFQSANNSR